MTRLIAYMTTPGGLTGAPRRLLTLADALEMHGIETCIASQPDSELLRSAKAEGHETAEVDATGVLALRQGALFGGGFWFRIRVAFDLLKQNWTLFRCIRAKHGHAVWIRGSKGIAYGALGAFLSRRPLIWDVDYELPSRGVVRWLHHFGLWASKAVVFQYRAAPDLIFGKKLSDHYRHKFTAIIPGIDLSALAPYRAMRLERIKNEREPFVIFQVGTVCDRKNQLLTIEALRLMKEREPNRPWELWLAYDAIQDPDVVTRVRQYSLDNHVQFLGWRDDVKSLMTKADILVMPSKDEGVPNAVQEAMAIGLPVVVSDAGGMPEIVIHGLTGWVVSIDDQEAWSAIISRCAENPADCETVSANASAFALTNFDTKSWGEEYAEVIRDSAQPLAAGGDC